MYTFKCFLQIDSFADNEEHVVAPIGEFSADANSYVRDYKIYTDGRFSDLTLLGLSSKDDDGNETATVVDYPEDCLEIGKWIIDRSATGDITPDEVSLRGLFNNELGDRFTLVGAGTHVIHKGNWYPTHITFTHMGQESSELITMWLSDSVFRAMFDESIIFVIPPVENVDELFNNRVVVTEKLEEFTAINKMEVVRNVQGKYPFTVLRMESFDWTDPNDEDIKIPSIWTLVIYGRSGDNIDNVKQAIRDYILENSTRDEVDWRDILPDIFKSTEFIITPAYFNQAIPDQQFERGVYSGLVTINDVLHIVKRCVKGAGYTDLVVDKSMSIMTSLFRSTPLAITNGPENKGGFETFRGLFWDFINVPTTHPDFMRMGKESRDMVKLLTEMVEHAEYLSPTSEIPIGFTRIERDGVWYLTKGNQDYQFLVVSKYSVLRTIDELKTEGIIDIPTDLE